MLKKIKKVISYIANEITSQEEIKDKKELETLLYNGNYTKFFYNLHKILYKEKEEVITDDLIIKLYKSKMIFITKKLLLVFYDDYAENLFMKGKSERWLFDIKYKEKTVEINNYFLEIDKEINLIKLLKEA